MALTLATREPVWAMRSVYENGCSSILSPMRGRPTFDQIAYTSDVGECLSLEQARCLFDRSRLVAELLARRVVAELEQRNLRPISPASPLLLWNEAELIASHGRNPDANWLCGGTVPFQNANMGPAMHIALQWWWEDDGLCVGWWLVNPVPTLDR